ncbi:MAG: acyl-ACP--UDP-N-acetylglucosamine O-acyltransferase [Lentisphaeria bacterium]|nr:acyl-ACP--UDP-N-acetylglucosamine O-acyltransferase [Lentisphaeria bacterium]
MAKIHPTAIIDPSAVIADDVEIGPYTIIENNVEIGENCKLHGQCRIGAYTKMGTGNEIYPFASVGTDPQDYSYDRNQISYTEIGNNNRFREGCTVNRGTKPGSVTKIGNNGFFMANAHIAHNCHVGDHVIMVAFSGIAGHCEIGDNALISGFAGIHQFCRMGRMAVLSGGSQISVDLPPFMIGDGRNGGVRGFNIVGMRRNGFSAECIRAIKDVYDIFFRQGLNVSNAVSKVEEQVPLFPEVVEFLDFVKSSKRGILTGDRGGRRA